MGTPAFSADYQKGLTASKSGDYATALREWKPLAEQGNARAQFSLGRLYHAGKGVPQHYKIAVKWYKLAAEQGNTVAQVNLGTIYYDGTGVPQDYMTAMKWYRLAAKQRNAPAQTMLGVMYNNGQGVLQDYKTSVKWFRLAAEQGDEFAQSTLKGIKTRLVTKGIEGCLFEQIAKVTGPETKKIVEKYCQNKLEKKSLDWLLRYAD